MLFHKDSDRLLNRMYIDSVLRTWEDMGLVLESMGCLGYKGRESPSLHSERGVVTFTLKFLWFFYCLIARNGKEVNIPMTAQK